jgi:hypothetical protein
VEFTGGGGKVRILRCLGGDKKKVRMWIFEGAWGIREGFGKRCGMEAIAGLVGLGADLKEGR